MNRKVLKYLNAKEEKEYNNLDIILSRYASGRLEELLKKDGFFKIDIFPNIGKSEKYLQINLRYYNLSVMLDFFDDHFDYCVYTPDDTPESIEMNLIEREYENDFNIEDWISLLRDKLGRDERLNEEVYDAEKKKIGKYKKLSRIFLILLIISVLTLVGLVLYATITRNTLYVVPAFFAVGISALIIYVIYGFYSGRSK